MTLDAAMQTRSAAAAMTDAASAMMDVIAKADRAGMARRPTVIKEHDTAAMDAGIRHVGHAQTRSQQEGFLERMLINRRG